MNRGIALAVLGDPLAYTRSPALHRAGLEAVGRTGSSAAIRTSVEALPERLRELRAHGFQGANLTTPLKEAVLGQLDRVSEAAGRARSVNTIGFAADGTWGDTTDGGGFIDLLMTLGRDPARERALILGGGGAARSLAHALCSCGASVVARVRQPEAAAAAWEGIGGPTLEAWDGRGGAGRPSTSPSLIVNTTPLARPMALDGWPTRTLIVDLRYGRQVNEWVREARTAGFEAYDGLGLLVFQARRSLALWLASPVPVDPLARAVGWPR